MNGATALPSVNIIKSPRRTSMATIGKSHHRFLTLIKSQSSLSIENLLKKSDRNFMCVLPLN